MCPTQGELMRASLPAEAARLLGATGTPATPVTATGSSQTDAYVLTGNMTIFGTVNSSTGCLLPSATGVAGYFIFNNGSNPLSVCPASSESINAGAANAAFSVTNGKGAMFYPHGNIWFANLSA